MLRLMTSKDDWPVAIASNDNMDRSSNTLALDCADLFSASDVTPLHPLVHLHFADLTPAFLAVLAPVSVVLPLIFGRHDALEVVEALEAMHYGGHILVVAPALPDPAMVQRELRAAGPCNRLTLISA